MAEAKNKSRRGSAAAASLSSLLQQVTAPGQPAPGAGSASVLPRGVPFDLAGDAMRGLPEQWFVDVDLIDVDAGQPRRFIDEAKIAELAETVRSQGVINPIALRAHPDHPDRYMIIAGERRWRAARLAGLSQIPARFFADVDTATARSLQLIENFDRGRINPRPWEEALAIGELVDLYGSQAAVVTALGMTKSKEWVSKRVALLNLPPHIKELIPTGRVSDYETLLMLGRLEGIDHARCAALCDQVLGGQELKRGDVAAMLREARSEKKAPPAEAVQWLEASSRLLGERIGRALQGEARIDSCSYTGKIKGNKREVRVTITLSSRARLETLSDFLRVADQDGSSGDAEG